MPTGGIKGRKIKFISYDDGYSPSKTVEQARKLVEDDAVLLIFSSLGTASNSAIRKYMNIKKVPQLFVFTGATEFGDPKHFPWTMGWQPTYQSEGRRAPVDESTTALRHYINWYLSQAHRDNIDHGCPVAGFAGDAPRLGAGAQSHFAGGLDDQITILAGLIAESGSPAVAGERRTLRE
jgi:hypothetical protein